MLQSMGSQRVGHDLVTKQQTPMTISSDSFLLITNMPEGKENMSKLLEKSNRLTICFILKTSKNQQLLTFSIFASDEFLNKASQM